MRLCLITKPLIFIMAVSVVFVFSCIDARADSSDTMFGVTINPKNEGTDTGEDIIEAIQLAARLGSVGTFIHSWNQVDEMPQVVDRISAMKHAGLTTMLQIQSNLVGKPAPPDGVSGTSYADEDVRARYLQDMESLAQTEPDYLILSTEINLLRYIYPDEYGHYISLFRETYNAVKAISPNTKIGVSVLHKLFIVEQQWFIVDDLSPIDFLGLSTYPIWLVDQGIVESIDDITSAWYGQVRQGLPDMPIIFSEVGWTSDDVEHPSSEMLQAYYVGSLPRLVADVQPEIVIWTLLHDTPYFNPDGISQEMIDLLISLGVDVDKLFNGFNEMGLRRRDGTPKPAWFRALQLDFSSP